jgi:hypothetical protein
METAVQHFNNCPNWLEAAEHVQRAAEHVDTDMTVRLEIVNTPQRAEEVLFRGSPTILIDGTDPFTEPDTPVGLSCRIYTTPSGMAGSPTTEQLVDLLTKPPTEDSPERIDDDG